MTPYLYDRDTEYVPTATKEGVDILNLINDFSCDVTVAADNVFNDDNPYIPSEINDYVIDWSISNDTNYEIVNNHLSVKSYAGLEDETLTITATIKPYDDQQTVSRDFTINTHILRATPYYYDVDATGYSEQLTRESEFTYNLTLKAMPTEGFTNPVKPVEDEIKYSFDTDNINVNYSTILQVNENNRFAVKENATLGKTVNIRINIVHYNANGTEIKDTEELVIPVTVASRTYIVTFVMNGGTIVDSNGVNRETVQLVEDSDIFASLSYSRPGYEFAGWYTDAGFSTKFNSNVMPSENLTLYAKWEALSYTVFFDANGGTVDPTSKPVLSDVALGELPVPERQYYTFDGWFTAASGGTQVTAESAFARTTDLTVYAHWTLNSFIVTFNANGGTCNTANMRAYCGQALGTLPTPTRTGFTFNGWYTAASGGTKVTASATYSVANNITLYAHWTVLSYTVSWNTGTGYSITVKRTSSPNGGALTGNLSNGATVYYPVVPDLAQKNK